MPTFACRAAKDLPIDMEMSWDGAAAKAAVFEWAGFNGDNPEPAKAQRAFLVVDTSDLSLKGSYHLPFATYDGGLKAVMSGCRAAASRLPQMNDLPQDVEDKARAVLDGYFKKADMEDMGDMSQPVEGERFTYQARVAKLTNTDELMALAQSAAGDRGVLEEFPPYFFSAVISTQKTDSYFTQMDLSSLQNFATEASEGRALLESHDSRQRPIGYSLQGRMAGGAANGSTRVEADFYVIRDPNTPEARGNQLIRDIRTGIQRDVSVGFYLDENGAYRCTICGRDMLSDWECMHFPGMKYPKSEKSTTMVTAKATIEGAHLAETSAVYDGATPGAMIIKAQREMEAGRLQPMQARLLEAQYRIKLPNARHYWSVAPPDADYIAIADRITQKAQGAAFVAVDEVLSELPADIPEGVRYIRYYTRDGSEFIPIHADSSTDDTDEAARAAAAAQSPDKTSSSSRKADDMLTLTTEQHDALRIALTQAGIPLGAEDKPDVVLTDLAGARVQLATVEAERANGEKLRADLETRLSASEAKVAELSPLADDGKQYRVDLIAEALAAGVRAMGDTFAQETYEQMLSVLPLVGVKRLRDDWNAAWEKLVPGGRVTMDDPERSNGKGDGVADRRDVNRLYAG